MLAGAVNVSAWCLRHDEKRDGWIEELSDTLHSDVKVIRTLAKGNFMGEISCMYNTVASSSCKCENYTTLGILVQSDVRQLFETFPEYRNMMEKNILENYIDH